MIEYAGDLRAPVARFVALVSPDRGPLLVKGGGRLGQPWAHLGLSLAVLTA